MNEKDGFKGGVRCMHKKIMTYQHQNTIIVLIVKTQRNITV